MSADELRVDAIAQDPFCAEPSLRGPRETYDEARERGFDNLPVRDPDGLIRRQVPTAALGGVTSWEVLERDAVALTTDQLVARDAPAFALLERFADTKGELLFCLGRRGIDGVVTVYDLNQPAAHLLAFGLILVCEAELTTVLRLELGEDPDEAKRQAEAVLGRGRMGVKRWEKARAANSELHLASSLTFGEKCELAPKYGLERLASNLTLDPASLLGELLEIRDLRNALVHYDDEDRLADPIWVHDKLLRTHVLARRIAESGGSP